VLLALDTATPNTTVAVADDQQVRAHRSHVDGRRHAEVLAPLIAESLAELEITPKELTRIVVGVGPGPFTGLRVGLVTAMALGDGLGIPVLGVVTLDVVAAAAVDGTASGTPSFLVATDARRKEVYWARYVGGVRSGPASVGRAADVAANYPRCPVAGQGARLYADVFGAHGCAVVGPEFPSAAALAEVTLRRLERGDAFEPVAPLYLRRPDAATPGERKPVTRV